MTYEIFLRSAARECLEVAEQLRGPQHRPDKAINMVTQFAGTTARRNLDKWTDVASDEDWVIVAGALRTATVCANSLLDTHIKSARDYIALIPQQQDAWFGKHAEELDKRKYTIHQSPINWEYEWRLNDRLATAQRIPRIRTAVIQDAATLLQDRNGINYLPRGTKVSDIPKSNAADTSAAGVALARLWKLEPMNELKDRALELTRWANGKNGPIPNPDRLAVVEKWLAKDKPETKLSLRNQLGIDLLALGVLMRKDVDPFVRD